MVNKIIVECPQCKMRFFVTDDLLNVAKGDLRCGFCLHIFNGKNSTVAEASDKGIASDSLADALNNTTEDNPLQSASLTKESNRSTAEFDNYSEDYWQEVVNAFSSFSINTNKSEETLASLQTNEETQNKPLSLMAHEENDPCISNHSISVDGDIIAFLDNIDFSGSLQQDEQQLLEKHNKKVQQIIARSEQTKSPTQAELVATELVVTKPQVETLAMSAATPKMEEAEDTHIQMENTPPSNDDTIVRDIYGNELKRVKAIDFENATSHQPVLATKMTIVWSFLSFLAVLLLVAQYLHYAIPKMPLAGQDRKWAEEVCRYVFCQLPVQVDVNKITTDRLVVRSDPNQVGVLLVDSIIYNNADFPQPYPIIELRFSNLNGQVVASRRFLPEQYLNDEVLGKNQMPSSMPVYISLQIIDPGEQATGYSLHYYPAPILSSH